jgi:uncharacterized membrane protein
MVLPAGSEIPPLLHLVVLLVATVAAAWVLRSTDPEVTEETVLGLAPWMIAGAAAYVTYELELVPTAVAPFAASPAVYLSMFVGAAVVWVLAISRGRDPAPWLAISGVTVAIPPVGAALLEADRLEPFAPLGAALVAAGVAGLLWWVLRAWEPRVEILGWAGVLTVFAHALDALTTVVGVVHLGFGERTPLSRLLIEAAAGMPLPVLGAGWLFVLVKLLLGTGVAWLLAPSVRERPREGFLLLTLVIGVGLGPGAHNVLLFTVAG